MRLIALTVLACAAVAADKPQLQTVPGDDVLAWIEIPDVKTAMDHVEATASRFAKAVGADDAPLAQALGQLLGPQELDALRPGAPVVAIVFLPKAAGGRPDIAWYLPVQDAATLQQAATRLGQ